MCFCRFHVPWTLPKNYGLESKRTHNPIISLFVVNPSLSYAPVIMRIRILPKTFSSLLTLLTLIYILYQNFILAMAQLYFRLIHCEPIPT